MPTKHTISVGMFHHLFEESTNNDSLFLELEEVELAVNILKNGRSGVRLEIPIKRWRKMLEDWEKHPWSTDTERDNAKITVTPEMFDKFVEGFKKRHPEFFSNENSVQDNPAE